MEDAVDEAVPGHVAETVQGLRHFLDNVVTAVVKYVRHVLHEERQRPERLHISEISQKQVAARVDLVGLRMVGDLPKLGPTDARVGLTWRAAHKHVNGIFHRPKSKYGGKLVGLDIDHVPGQRMQLHQVWIAAVKVHRMGEGR
jgi:hypothetical protein